MLHNEYIPECLDIIATDEFYKTADQKICNAIKNLHNKGQAEWLVPFVLVRDVEIKGPPYLVPEPEPEW